jgi:hypothetical protein
MADLEFKIATPADTTGATQADAALTKNISTVNALKEAAKELTAEGQKAYEALAKLGKTDPSAAAAVADLNKQAEAVRNNLFARVAEAPKGSVPPIIEATNRGGGLATPTPSQLSGRLQDVGLTAKELEQLENYDKKQRAAFLSKKAATEESERQSKVLRELKTAQEGEAEATEKGTGAKKRWREVVQGLGAAHLGFLGTLVRGIITPMGATVAIIGGAIAGFRRYIQIVQEAGVASNEFGTRNERIKPLSAIITEGLSGRDAVINSLNQIVLGMDSVARHLADTNTQLGVTAGLSQQIALAQSAEEMTRIEGQLARGEITLAQAIGLRDAAQRKAREFAEQQVIKTLEKQADAERKASVEAFEAAKRYQASGEAAQANIDKQISAVEKAAADVTDITGAGAAQLARNKEMLFFLQTLQQETGGGQITSAFGRTGIALGHPQLLTDAITRFGGKGFGEAQTKVEEEISAYYLQISQAKRVQASEERKLAQLKTRQSTADQKAIQNTQTGEEAQHRAALLQQQIEATKSGQAEIDAANRRADAIKKDTATREAATEEFKRFWSERDAQQKEIESGAPPRALKPLDAGVQERFKYARPNVNFPGGVELEPGRDIPRDRAGNILRPDKITQAPLTQFGGETIGQMKDRLEALFKQINDALMLGKDRIAQDLERQHEALKQQIEVREKNEGAIQQREERLRNPPESRPQSPIPDQNIEPRSGYQSAQPSAKFREREEKERAARAEQQEEQRRKWADEDARMRERAAQRPQASVTIPDQDIEAISDTARSMAEAAKRINKGLGGFEEAIEIMAQVQQRVEDLEEAVSNLRPA